MMQSNRIINAEILMSCLVLKCCMYYEKTTTIEREGVENRKRKREKV